MNNRHRRERVKRSGTKCIEMKVPLCWGEGTCDGMTQESSRKLISAAFWIEQKVANRHKNVLERKQHTLVVERV
jgi:hypothetical protein